MKTSDILGLNARSMLFSYKYNNALGKNIASSKLATKNYLGKTGIPIPKLYAKFSSPEKIIKFDWKSLPEAFALKPNKGLGGEGIIVVKKKSSDGEAWITTTRKRITIEDLKLHAMDILEGAYSIGNVPDTAFVEEYVGRHKMLRKFAYRGTPDIRVIVFNKVPVMAMLRLPTKESGGRANLHQGAIAVGVDMATGITTKAYWHGEYITRKPGSKKKLHGIKIPKWTKVLETAVNCQEATGLGYLGADIVLHPDRGPMVLELNFMPGLQIQMANGAGLLRRLQRVEDLSVKDAEHGVRVAQVLFAERFADKVKVHDEIKILNPIEKVKIYPPKKKSIVVNARIDTGALRSSIDKKLAEDLGLLEEDNILWRKRFVYKSASGRQPRPVIALTVKISGKKINTTSSVVDRSRLSTPLLIGRNDMDGFMIKGGGDKSKE